MTRSKWLIGILVSIGVLIAYATATAHYELVSTRFIDRIIGGRFRVNNGGQYIGGYDVGFDMIDTVANSFNWMSMAEGTDLSPWLDDTIVFYEPQSPDCTPPEEFRVGLYHADTGTLEQVCSNVPEIRGLERYP